MPDVRLEDQQDRGRYVLNTEDGQEAYITFTHDRPNHISITYSYVPPAFRGRGLAAGLVARAVEDARAAGVTITPLCGYVAAEFRRHKEWQDVLA
ncbi:MAG: N-acetyltransferase [Rhizobiaceae bacterium]|nr:N-acetyltransferase [Rhizobiaceae bacterium]